MSTAFRTGVPVLTGPVSACETGRVGSATAAEGMAEMDARMAMVIGRLPEGLGRKGLVLNRTEKVRTRGRTTGFRTFIRQVRGASRCLMPEGGSGHGGYGAGFLVT